MDIKRLIIMFAITLVIQFGVKSYFQLDEDNSNHNQLKGPEGHARFDENSDIIADIGLKQNKVIP